MSDNLPALAIKIANATSKGVIVWEAANAASFRALFKNGSIIIQRSFSDGPDGEIGTIEIRVYNKTGKLVDQFDDEDLQKISKPPGGLNHWYEFLKSIHNNARRYALKSDEVISNLIAEIDSAIFDADIPF